jgi:DMATS type aromatic prenyltransferase
MSSLLKNAGSYTPSQQKSHLQFLKEYIIPNMGPPPTKTQPKYLLTPTGSPFEASINLSDTGKPRVRFNFDPQLPAWDSPGASASPVSSIAEAVQADMHWFSQFRSEFCLSGEESEAIKSKMPPETAHIPQCFLAFDLDGSARSMKAYFSPIMKHMVTSNDSDAACIEMLRRLDPGLVPAMQFIAGYKEMVQEPPLVQVIGVDCMSPRDGARVKIYTTLPENSFAAVREHVTFGGSKTDSLTLQGLSILREIWGFLINEEGDVSDGFEKDLRIPADVGGHPGLTCSWECKPGEGVPDVKVYVPLWQYCSSDSKIIENLEKVFEMRGWEWGGYRGLFEEAL